VVKGKKLPGHQGAATVTIENLEIVGLRPKENLLFLKGAVPGKKNGIVIIKPSKKVPADPAAKK